MDKSDLRGLRSCAISKQNQKFINFWVFVQQQARAQGMVFFEDFEEGNPTMHEDMELVRLSGWLIPQELADEFEHELGDLTEPESDRFDNRFVFVEWKLDNDKLSIVFEDAT
jgi:hypothetical protein